MKFSIVVFAAAWIVGVYGALLLDWRGVWIAAVGMLCLILFCLVLPLAAAHKRSFVLYCSLMIVSGLYSQFYDHLNRSELSDWPLMEGRAETAEIAGTIASEVIVDGDRVSFEVQTARIKRENDDKAAKLEEKVQIHIRLLTEREQREAKRWRRGDSISLSGQFRKPSTARNYGGFDYANYLRMKHMHWIVSVKGLDRVRVQSLSGWSKHRILRWNDGARRYLGGRIDSMFTPEHSGFMQSLLIGLRGELDPKQFGQFSQLGLTHILAISGLHVAVFLGGCMGLMRVTGVPRETNQLIAMVLVPGYVLLSGGSPSVVRAGLMAMIALYAARRGWLKDGLYIISAVGCLMLVWNPYYLLDISFQLSFLVTVGLIVGVPRVVRLIPIPWPALNGLIAVTIVAQFVSFPLTIYYFNQFSLISWLANLILVPLISLVVLPLGYIALILGWFSAAGAEWLAWVIERINAGCFRIINILNEIQAFITIWPSPSLYWITVYYLLLCGFVRGCIALKQARSVLEGGDLLANKTTKRQAAAMTAGFSFLICLLLWYGYDPDRFNTEAEVNFIDVGQGDSILIRTASRTVILVDGGGTMVFRKPGEAWKERRDPYEVGKKLLVPLLKKRGVRHIDYVIATHEDADHIGGLYAVLEHIPVSHLLFNGTLKTSAQAKRLFQLALDKNIPLVPVSQGFELKIDDSSHMEFLSPAAADNAGKVKIAEDQNELSLVFILQMYRYRFLFTGDVDEAVESEWLLRTGAKNEYGKIDVLKVAHHGSKSSTSAPWLDYWRPAFAVVSAGQNNIYGHPNKHVLARLRERGTAVYRTDQQGEVQFKVGEQALKVRTKLIP
jgi:competence protein ComEC